MGENRQLRAWKGKFGAGFTERNMISLREIDRIYQQSIGYSRTALNEMFLSGFPRSARILEIGVNTANQLLFLQKMGFNRLFGIEPQGYAVELSKRKTRNINIIQADAFDIPFKDRYFDLVFTSGVLIHIHPRNVKKAIAEIHRCSNKYIWGYEYYAEGYTRVAYRGKSNLLWKTDFAKLYLDLFPDLALGLGVSEGEAL